MAACITSPEPLPLDITINVPTSATTTDSVAIVVQLQGSSLLGVVVDFGDGGEPSSFLTGGARIATVTFRHRFTQSGTYDVTGTVSDAVLGQKDASVQLSIQ
jgi:hypothetical protein